MEYVGRNGQPIKEDSAYRFGSNLASALSQAVRERITKKDFIFKSEHSRTEQTAFRALSHDDQAKLWAWDNPRGKYSLEKAWLIMKFLIKTGLSYVDANALRTEPISVEEKAQLMKYREGAGFIYTDLKHDGRLAIKGWRQKTIQEYHQLLDEETIEIIEQLKALPHRHHRRGHVLPGDCRSNINALLKELANEAGLESNLSTHMGRHTFETDKQDSGIYTQQSIMRMVGVSKPESLKTYTKPSNESQYNDEKRAVENQYDEDKLMREIEERQAQLEVIKRQKKTLRVS